MFFSMPENTVSGWFSTTGEILFSRQVKKLPCEALRMLALDAQSQISAQTPLQWKLM